MGKALGKGGSDNTSTVTSQTTPNPVAQGAYQTAVNTGTAASQSPYQVYPGARVAGFTPEQIAGFNNVNSAAGIAQPYYEQAAKLIQASTAGVNPAATIGDYTNPALQGYLGQASNFANAAGQSVDPSQTVGKYSNPALQGYLNPAQGLMGTAGQGVNAGSIGQYINSGLSSFTTPGANAAASAAQGTNPLSGQFGVQNFMNPYTQNVVSSMQDLQKQNDAIQQNNLVGSAASAGAFGGDRAAIAQSTLAGQQDLANNASLANVLQSGYGQALNAAMQTGTTNAQLGLGAGQLYGQLGGLNQGAYNTALGAAGQNAQLALGAGQGLGQLGGINQSAWQSALGTGLSAGQLSGQLGLGASSALGQLGSINQGAYNTALQTGLGAQEANAWIGQQGAFGMGNIGTAAQNSAMSGANAQIAVGGLGQQLGQEQLNVPYSDWQAANAYPFQIGNYQLGLATGSPGGGSSSTTSPGPSTASQLTGLGLTGLGVYNAYNNSGGFGNLSGGSSGASLDSLGAANAGINASAGADAGSSTLFPQSWFSARGGRIGYDDGGAVTAPLGLGANMPSWGLPPGTQAGLGSGNPQLTGQVQQLNSLPTEKLREMQARMPSGTPQGNLVAMALRHRMMMPQSNPAMAGLGTVPTMPGMAAGGALSFDDGGAMPPEDDTAEQYRLLAGQQGAFSNLTDGTEQPALPNVPGGSVRPTGLGTPPGTLYGDAGYSSQNWDAVVGKASAESGIPAPVLHGLFQTESDWNPAAVNKSSGATGLGQVLPSTAKSPGYGLAADPAALTDPKENILFSAKYLAARGKSLFGDKWDPTNQQQMRAALNAYSGGGGDAYADKVLGGGASRGLGGDRPVTVAQEGGDEGQPVGLGAQPVEHHNGLGAQPSFLDRLTQGGNGALIAAGLGIMGGQSPFALTNIGQGALSGLNYAEHQRQTDVANALRQSQVDAANAYRQDELGLRRDTLTQNEALRRDQLNLRQDALDKNRYTSQVWQQPDPDHPGQFINGILQIPTGGGEPKFIPVQGMSTKQAGSDAALNQQYNLDSAAENDLHGDDYLKTLKPYDAERLKKYAEGKAQFPTGFAAGKPEAKALLNAVTQYDPSFDAVNYNARNQTRVAFTKGKQADAMASFGTALGHAANMANAIDKLGNINFTPYNSVANWALEKRGDPRIARFEMDQNALSDELMRSFRLSNGAQAEVENWRKTLDRSQSTDYLKAAVGEAGTLLQSRIDNLLDQYQRGMGTTATPLELQKAQASLDALTRWSKGDGPAPKLNERGELVGGDRAAPASGNAPPAVRPPVQNPMTVGDLPENQIIIQGNKRYQKLNGVIVDLTP